MVITPNSDVILLKCPLELDERNQLSFTSKNAQYDYFYNLPKLVVGTDYTYVRKDNYIRVDELIDNLYQYNYVMYRNDSYSNKWFYAFIERMEYVNDRVTNVYIKCDTFQTWQFDLNYKRTFVEREHVNDDTIGANTIPENLELGDYQIVDLTNVPIYETSQPLQDWFICFCVTKLLGSWTSINGEITDIGGVFNSCHYFAVNSAMAGRSVIQAYEATQGNTSEDIINIYMIPRCCVDEIDEPTIITGGTYNVALYPVKQAYNSGTYWTEQSSRLAGGYQPVNNKLYTYPFSYFYATNNTGEDVTYRWEDFPIVNGHRRATYRKMIVPSTSLSAKIYFTNIKGYEEESGYGSKPYNYGLNFSKVPVCAWTTDYYTNWLTQNGVNVATNLTSGVLSGLSAMGSGGNPIQGTASLISTIGGTLGEIQRASTTPNQAHGNINTGDFVFAYLRNSISFYDMSIRPEVARVCDNFFSMFGYKVNRVKVPNVTGRYNWNYVKTIGCYIEADIPQDDLQEIKSMFDNGLTIWHRSNTFMDYSQSNPIV